jgi:hypothetical protein
LRPLLISTVVRRVGESIGDEARRQDVHVVLGPTMNIHRSPLGGRGFECFSEDRLLVPFELAVRGGCVGFDGRLQPRQR